MKHSNKPTILLLTSSFPSSPSDETCGYIRDFARSLSAEFNIKVLAPPDRYATRWPVDSFTLIRSRSVVPLALDPFQASADLNELASQSLFTRLAAFVSLLCFFSRALVLSLRADLILSHWMLPCGVIGASISGALGKPHIVIEHSGALHLLTRMRGGRLITRFIVAASDRVFTVSADLRRKLIAMCPAAESKTDVTPMGVNSSDFLARESDSGRAQRQTILFVGRLTEVKGLDLLLNAMVGLDARLIVAGEGERRLELETLSRDLRVDATFLGRITARQRSKLFSSCDAVVIPSRVLDNGRTEGTPVVCLEAMAAGRIVIASRVGGLPEIIVDGENGLLFEPADHRMLRDKLMLALRDDSLHKRISEYARRTAAAYDWSEIGPRFNKLITSALRRKLLSATKSPRHEGARRWQT